MLDGEQQTAYACVHLWEFDFFIEKNLKLSFLFKGHEGCQCIFQAQLNS